MELSFSGSMGVYRAMDVQIMFKLAQQCSIFTFFMVVSASTSHDVDPQIPLKTQRMVSIMATRAIPCLNGNVSPEADTCEISRGMIPK